MILGRIRLLLLFDTESQSSSKQIWIVMVFKRLKHCVNHFGFWWYVIQQPFTKFFSLLHTLREEIVYVFLISTRYLMVPKVMVVKLVWDRLKSTHQICSFFVLLISPLPRHVSTLPFWAYNNLLYLALLRWHSIVLRCDCSFLFMNIFLYGVFKKIKFVFAIKK